jgi:hypothetical protein
MLKIDLEPGQAIMVGDMAKVLLESKSGRRARLSVEAGKDVPIKKVNTQTSDARVAANRGLPSFEF